MFIFVQEYFFFNLNFDLEECLNDVVGRFILKEKVLQFQYDVLVILCLGIFVYNWWNEVLYGVVCNGKVMVFFQVIGMAVIFNEDFIYQVVDVIFDEARAKYNVVIQCGIYV